MSIFYEGANMLADLFSRVHYWESLDAMHAHHSRMTSAEIQQSLLNQEMLVQQRLQLAAFRAAGQQSALRLSSLVVAPRACNCRNCGAPFEPAETQCSYCRSER